MHKLIATGLGIGYIRKGGGTVAAAVCCVGWYLTQAGGYHFWPALLITLVLTLIGIWSASEVEQYWGKDNYRVVIDEIAGMCISLLFIPVSIKTVLVALLLFRIFDIAKPFYIRRLESLPGGWGVMLDDVLAGIYANIVLQVLLWLNWL